MTDDQKSRLEEENSTARRANLLGFNYFDTSKNQIQLYNNILSVEAMYHYRAVPLILDNSNLLFGITTTTSKNAINEIVRNFSDHKVSFVIISDRGYKDYMDKYDPPKEVQYSDVNIVASQDNSVERVSKILEEVKSSDMLAYLVNQAHSLNASDIHIETGRQDVRIRFRIDGVLHVIAKIGFDRHRMLVSAIASAGNISTSSKAPQEGHISQTVEMANHQIVDVNLRIETVVTINGMDIVMRLFNLDASTYNLDRLGLSVNERTVLDDIISKPSGLVMVVGPTGSGKTTTLYSILNSLNNSQRKIITVEDPVEFEFEGIEQISLMNDLIDSTQTITFIDQLKAILRLDPDILMIGEIRDEETAITALQAALTGHLVLATFHAGSAAASLARLKSIIGRNPLFVSSIRIIMAQRLVRRLNDQTKLEYQPTLKDLEFLSKMAANISDSILKQKFRDIKLYQPNITDNDPFGYSGQIAIREQIVLNDDLIKILLKNDNNEHSTTKELEMSCRENNIGLMVDDAARKLIDGQTSLAEISRVLDLFN